MFSYHFNESEEIKRYIIELEAVRLAFENVKALREHREKILRQSILRSSVFSARIEGNPLTMSTYDRTSDEEIHKMEINNLLKIYHRVYSSDRFLNVNEAAVRELHEAVMKNISNIAGKYRQEPWAVYDSSGNVIHLAPPYMKIPELMREYVEYINLLNYHPAIKAAIAQFILEKIHPFADGNGRAGRLVSALILKLNNYHLGGMLPFEEYTDNHRGAYYYALEPSADMTEFVEYFLKSLVVTGKDILGKLSRPTASSAGLPPRRQEILEIIGDHPNCSFDFLQRRFPTINSKTLHYDVKKLLDLGLIKKLGATRGALYRRV